MRFNILLIRLLYLLCRDEKNYEQIIREYNYIYVFTIYNNLNDMCDYYDDSYSNYEKTMIMYKLIRFISFTYGDGRNNLCKRC